MKIHLSVTGLDLTGELEKYANRKITQLAKKVPRGLRTNAVCGVHFVQKRKKGAKFNTCSIQFVLDGAELKAEETTLHMYTALDIAAVHVERQLVDYAKQHRHPLRDRLRRHFRAD